MIREKISKVIIFFILFLLISSSLGICKSKGSMKSSKIKAIDKIIDEGMMAGVGVSTAIQTGKNIVHLLGVDKYEEDQYMAYNLKEHKSKVVLESKSEGLPIADSLGAVSTEENIYIFGGRVKRENGYESTDRIYRFDLDNNKLKKLNISLPSNETEKSTTEAHSRLAVVWAKKRAYLFMKNRVYTFDPDEKAIKKIDEVYYPNDFFKGIQNKNTVYMDKKVYFLRQDDIYKYDIPNNKLSRIGKISTKHPDLWRRSAVSTGRYIYIMGGGGLGQKIVDEIIRFNPRNGETKILDTRLPKPFHGCNLVHAGGYIYIFGAYKKFDPNSKHGRNVNKIFRFNYQGLESKDNYPGIHEEDSLPTYFIGLIATTVVLTVGGAGYFWKYKR